MASETPSQARLRSDSACSSITLTVVARNWAYQKTYWLTKEVFDGPLTRPGGNRTLREQRVHQEQHADAVAGHRCVSKGLRVVQIVLSLEQLAVRAGVPSGDSTTCTLLKGGLSHPIIRADVDDRSYLGRGLAPPVSEAGLAVPLEQESENTFRAATTRRRRLALHA